MSYDEQYPGDDEYEYWAGATYDPDRDCPRCKGSGRVPTESHESYLGANYKPCPDCNGDPCIG
jgi:DnaJ-class molecular chaperone